MPAVHEKQQGDDKRRRQRHRELEESARVGLAAERVERARQSHLHKHGRRHQNGHSQQVPPNQRACAVTVLAMTECEQQGEQTKGEIRDADRVDEAGSRP